jgi:hypothetical protein
MSGELTLTKPPKTLAEQQRDALLTALKCWPLNELLGLVEDSGDEKMCELAKWFIEVRDVAIATVEAGKVPVQSKERSMS